MEQKAHKLYSSNSVAKVELFSPCNMAQHLSWEMTNVRTIWATPSVYSTCYRSLRFQGLLAHNRLESLRYYAASSLYAEFHMKHFL